MTKTFIVSIDSDATKEQRDAFTNELRIATGVGFWHHIETTWIIRDPRSNPFTCQVLRNRLTALMPLAYSLVLEVKATDWASSGTDDGNKWLENYILK